MREEFGCRHSPHLNIYNRRIKYYMNHIKYKNKQNTHFILSLFLDARISIKPIRLNISHRFSFDLFANRMKHEGMV